jgi:hypothetical protein
VQPAPQLGLDVGGKSVERILHPGLDAVGKRVVSGLGAVAGAALQRGVVVHRTRPVVVRRAPDEPRTLARAQTYRTVTYATPARSGLGMSPGTGSLQAWR